MIKKKLTMSNFAAFEAVTGFVRASYAFIDGVSTSPFQTTLSAFLPQYFFIFIDAFSNCDNMFAC